MADFNKAFEYLISQQGLNPSLVNNDTYDSKTILLCSECFLDEGLRRDAFSFGIKNKKNCEKCKSKFGAKLTKVGIHKLCYRFFTRGTIEKTKYGGSPVIQFNEHFFGRSEVKVSDWLAQTLERFGKNNAS